MDGSILAALAPRQRDVARRLARAFTAGGRELYLVGGIVRDVLLRRPLPNDLDLATSALPEETTRLGRAAGADAVYDVGARFGTVGFVFGAERERVAVEITTYRREHYPDETRFPAVALGGTLEEDLARRDFTANAIAAGLDGGGLVDPYGGEADIALAVLRAVGDPDDRFAEDPLRLLRAARFVAQLGFRLDALTEAAMARNAPSLERISRERVLAELDKLLVGEWAAAGLEALRRTGLLAVALPELAPLAAEAEAGARGARPHREKELWDHTLRVVSQAPARPHVRWAALLHDAAKPLTRGVDAAGEVHFFGHEPVGADLATKLLRRLKTDKATQAAVRLLVALHGRPTTYEPDWTDSAVRRLALDAGEVWDDLLDLAAADVTSGREEKRRAAAARVAGLRAHFARLQAEADLDKLQSPLDGNELMALFARPPGIWIKRVKDDLRERVIDGELAPDDKTEAERIARELVAAEETARSGGSVAVGSGAPPPAVP
ncbi:MAG: CCA tRNA nucleotidyltransferase [uncultured Thermomicrobiales bacterium]|uniref:CCA tRNA nucleotidyltransferase n=1 Tax=uncultured Thermomicrobiales bacterium TaxID=1645740 RepID=A0A6J4UE30_9BACT|nr:MAG: CCA tRNA nucleotidyltransferase [uncultured Thermomicrobiales bacterium]